MTGVLIRRPLEDTEILTHRDEGHGETEAEIGGRALSDAIGSEEGFSPRAFIGRVALPAP